MLNISVPTHTIIALALLFSMAVPASAIVMHDESQQPVDRPSDWVVGRWVPNNPGYGKATVVAIAPNYVLTTRHQGYVAGTTVYFGDGEDSAEYKVAQVFTTANVDLMLARIETPQGNHANLSNYANIFTGSDTTNRQFVLAGYGKGKGAELKTASNVVYGYTWAGADNTTLRWGLNHIDSFTTLSYTSWMSFSSQGLLADFDPTGYGEATIALWDSGAPWFIKVGDEWQVAGVSATTWHRGGENAPNESWFRNPTNGQSYPDYFSAVRLSTYSDWILQVLAQPLYIKGDANRDGYVDDSDLSLLLANWRSAGATWEQGDFNGDGHVNDDDLSLLLANWRQGTAPASSANMVPDPATLSLLGLGGLLAIRRRRRR